MISTLSKPALRVAAIMLALCLLSPLAAEASEIKILKSEKPESKEVIYAAQSEQCEMTWTSRKPNDGADFVISERSKCALPLPDQKALRAALLERVSDDTDGLKGLRSFYWGRLLRGDATDEFASRLAQAASKSSDWNGSKGRPVRKASGLNAFVVDTLNESGAFRELDEAFAQRGLSLRVKDVEKVIVSNKEPTTGKKMAEKLPIDCIVTFSVSHGE